MAVAYFSNNNNNVSRLGYSNVRNDQQEGLGIGFDGCFDQSLNKKTQTSVLGKMESMIWQQMLKRNDDSRRFKDKRY